MYKIHSTICPSKETMGLIISFSLELLTMKQSFQLYSPLYEEILHCLNEIYLKP